MFMENTYKHPAEVNNEQIQFRSRQRKYLFYIHILVFYNIH